MNDASSLANRLDFHLYQDSLYLFAFLLAAGLGVLLGRELFRKRVVGRDDRPGADFVLDHQLVQLFAIVADPDRVIVVFEVNDIGRRRIRGEEFRAWFHRFPDPWDKELRVQVPCSGRDFSD